jgi:hypothetical protein
MTRRICNELIDGCAKRLAVGSPGRADLVSPAMVCLIRRSESACVCPLSIPRQVMELVTAGTPGPTICFGEHRP